MNVLLSTITLAVCLALCVFVYFKDKVEKEPITLLALLFGLGILAYVIKYFLSNFVIGIFDELIRDQNMMQNASDELFNTYHWTSSSAEFLHKFLCSFIGVALISEVLKWCALFFTTRKNENFDYYFDGVEYSIFVALGFALAENVHFAFMNSWNVFITHFTMSLPVHLLCGIVMGVIYSKYHIKYIADIAENKMIRYGILKDDIIKAPILTMLLSLIAPTVIHFIFDYFDAVRTDNNNYIFYIVSAVAIICCFIFIVIESKKDKADVELAEEIIKKSHQEYDKDVAPVSQYDSREGNGEVDDNA